MSATCRAGGGPFGDQVFDALSLDQFECKVRPVQSRDPPVLEQPNDVWVGADATQSLRFLVEEGFPFRSPLVALDEDLECHRRVVPRVVCGVDGRAATVPELGDHRVVTELHPRVWSLRRWGNQTGRCFIFLFLRDRENDGLEFIGECGGCVWSIFRGVGEASVDKVSQWRWESGSTPADGERFCFWRTPSLERLTSREIRVGTVADQGLEQGHSHRVDVP